MTPRPEILKWAKLTVAIDEAIMEHGPKSVKAQIAWRMLREHTRTLVACSAVRWQLICQPVARSYAKRWKIKQAGGGWVNGTQAAMMCEVQWRRMLEEISFEIGGDDGTAE